MANHDFFQTVDRYLDVYRNALSSASDGSAIQKEKS